MATIQGIKVVDAATLDDLVRAIGGTGSIRLVKLQDYGFTSPVDRDGVVVIQPMIRLVVTAFDKQSGTIHRWQETTEARRALDVRPVGSGSPEGSILMEKDRVRELLQLEGFSVEKGEWTPAAVEALLGRTGS